MDVEPVDRYVTFADLLGFKQLVRNNPHDELMRTYKDVILKAVEYGVGGGVDHDPGLATVNMLMISDSVVLWTDEDRPSEFVAMVQAATNLLAAGIHYGVPMRAATAWGKVEPWAHSYSNPRLRVETVLGAGFVDAYGGEGGQHWSGGVVLDNAVERYRTSSALVPAAPDLDDLVESKWLVPYAVPLLPPENDPDARPTKTLYAYNWTRPFVVDQLHEGDVANPFADYGKGGGASVQAKIANTIAFARHMGRYFDE